MDARGTLTLALFVAEYYVCSREPQALNGERLHKTVGRALPTRRRDSASRFQNRGCRELAYSLSCERSRTPLAPTRKIVAERNFYLRQKPRRAGRNQSRSGNAYPPESSRSGRDARYDARGSNRNTLATRTRKELKPHQRIQAQVAIGLVSFAG